MIARLANNGYILTRKLNIIKTNYTQNCSVCEIKRINSLQVSNVDCVKMLDTFADGISMRMSKTGFQRFLWTLNPHCKLQTRTAAMAHLFYIMRSRLEEQPAISVQSGKYPDTSLLFPLPIKNLEQFPWIQIRTNQRKLCNKTLLKSDYILSGRSQFTSLSSFATPILMGHVTHSSHYIRSSQLMK